MNKRLNVLIINNYDLVGRRFNGYDLINKIKMNIKQIVIEKQSKNREVSQFFNSSKEYYLYRKFIECEDKLSLQGVFSITSPILLASQEYKTANIIHIQLLHNSHLSLYSLKEIATQKKLIISFHDPWLLTGHCVHYYDCDLWKSQKCYLCPYLERYFPLKKDNSQLLWKLKYNILSSINYNILLHSNWMLDSVNSSKIIPNNIRKYHIPLGVDIDLFKKREKSKAFFKIDNRKFVVFFRVEAQFKGIEYIIEALKDNKDLKNMVILTCGKKGLIEELKKKYDIIELGQIDTETLIHAYSAADIFLMPSTGESFGLMAVEAMACSCPVIIFDKTALPSVTFAPECGYLVKYKNSKKLREAILYLKTNTNERKHRGKLGRQLAVKNYNIKSYYFLNKKMYLEVYNRKKEEKQTFFNNIAISPSNDNNILFLLNNITNSIFKKTISKTKILYDCEFDVEPIEYDKLCIQSRIDEYCKRVLKFIREEKIHVPIKYKLIYYTKQKYKLYKFVRKVLKN